MRVLLLLAVVLPPLALGLPARAEQGLPATPAQAFEEAVRLEAEGEFMASAARFEAAAREGLDEGYWRAARNTWRFADELPVDHARERVALFTRADALAGQGLAADPRCGACALWKYASLGRLTEHHGWVWAGRRAKEMKTLLDLGIEHRPEHRDASGNVTLANLYYASATFHRMVPDWWWLPLLVGVRGDTERALTDIRAALGFSEDRIDYHVEHAAVLLCDVHRGGREERLAEGRAALHAALALPVRMPSDEIDQGYARELLAHPEKACGWSRRGFYDVEGEGKGLAGQLRAGR